jgi:hypothetical protein
MISENSFVIFTVNPCFTVILLINQVLRISETLSAAAWGLFSYWRIHDTLSLAGNGLLMLARDVLYLASPVPFPVPFFNFSCLFQRV